MPLAALGDQEHRQKIEPRISRLVVIRSTLWRLGDGIGSEVFSFIFFLALGRLLAPDAFGIVAIAGAFIQACQVMFRGGFGTAVLQKAELRSEHLTAAVWGNFGLSIICSLIVVGIIWPLSISQGKGELLPVLAALTPVLLVSSVSWIYQAHFRRLLRYDLTALSTSVSIVVGGVAGVALAHRGFGVWSLVGQQIFGALAGLATLVLSTTWRPGMIFSPRHLRDLAGFASKTSAADVLDFFRRMDAVILGFFLSAHAIGLYSVAARLTTTVATVSLYITYDLTMAFLPRFPARTQEFREAAYRTMQFTLLFSLPAFIGVALLADGAIALLFGPLWVGSVRPFQVMCIFSVVHAFTLTGRQILNAAGCAGVGLGIAAVNTALYLVAVLLAAPAGPTAAAAAGGLASILCLPLVSLALHRKLGLQFRRMVSDQVPTFAATLVMAGSVALAGRMDSLTAVAVSPLAVLLVKAGLGAVVFIAALRLIAPNFFKSLLGWSELRARGKSGQ